MRYLFCILLGLIVCSCIAPKKVEALRADYDRQLTRADSTSQVQQTTISHLDRRIAGLEGANEALLTAQSRLEDKLVAQKDQIDDLSGNLSSTNTRLQDRIATLQEELAAEQLAGDSLLLRTRALAEKFEELAVDAEQSLRTVLNNLLPDAEYTISKRDGETILSVQEEVLFAPRTTDRLKDESVYVFRAVIEALQDDPLLKLSIVGHTDNRPNGRSGMTNWQFAALRAAHLTDQFITTYSVSPNRVIAASQGEFRPVASNGDETGRRANRRIDFVLYGTIGNLLRDLRKLEK